jgi:UDP-glucose-4-epimerase GalE
MRLLVTGGAGYVGSHALRWFLEHGHKAWAIDNLSRGHAKAVPAGRLLKGDIADQRFVEDCLRTHRIDAVFHFAAFALVGESVEHPERYYQNNLVGSLALLEAMRRCGVERLVFSSTCAVYGVPDVVPLTEDGALRPISPYGRAKLGVEWALADYASAHGLACACLRYFNAAGAHHSAEMGEDHDPETHLIPLVLQVALGLRPHIDILGTDYPTPDGTCIRDYIHVDDLAAAHLAAVEWLTPHRPLVLNLGTGRGHSVRDVVDTCVRVTGRPIPVRERPRRPGDPPVLVAANQRAREVLNWAPRYLELSEIIESAWRWHRSHPSGYGSSAS